LSLSVGLIDALKGTFGTASDFNTDLVGSMWGSNCKKLGGEIKEGLVKWAEHITDVLDGCQGFKLTGSTR